MEQTRQIKQFQFYDFYAEILNGLTDESVGRIARLICEYMFTDNAVAEIKDDKERFYWGNIVDVLQESKENEIKGKQSTGLNRKMKHFTFQYNFYDAKSFFFIVFSFHIHITIYWDKSQPFGTKKQKMFLLLV